MVYADSTWDISSSIWLHHPSEGTPWSVPYKQVNHCLDLLAPYPRVSNQDCQSWHKPSLRWPWSLPLYLYSWLEDRESQTTVPCGPKQPLGKALVWLFRWFLYGRDFLRPTRTLEVPFLSIGLLISTPWTFRLSGYAKLVESQHYLHNIWGPHSATLTTLLLFVFSFRIYPLYSFLYIYYIFFVSTHLYGTVLFIIYIHIYASQP